MEIQHRKYKGFFDERSEESLSRNVTRAALRRAGMLRNEVFKTGSQRHLAACPAGRSFEIISLPMAGESFTVDPL
jgi:hypothetical protein